jgi:hypothetical protein
MFTDATAMVCFYTSYDFDETTPITCAWQPDVNYAWAILPYWWRMWQCLRRWYDDRNNTNQLLNAGKYFWGVMAGFT